MIKLIQIFLICCLPCALFSQDLKIEFNPGIGTYSMEGLKAVNNSIMESLPFKAKLTNNFPPFVYYKMALISDLNSLFSFGLVGVVSSTGSRINVKDYSGEYRFDQKVSLLSPGATVRLKFSHKKFHIDEYNNVYYSYSKLKTLEYTQFGSNIQENNADFIANVFQAELGLNLFYRYQYFDIGLSGGYLYDFKSNYEMVDTQARLAKTGWDGLRLGLYTAFH